MTVSSNLHSRTSKVTILLSVLSALLFIGTPFLGTAKSNAQERRLTPKTLKDAPLEVRQVRNLQNEENWFRDLEIEVENVSIKPIYFIALGVEFPDIPAPSASARTGFSLKYGRPELGLLDVIPEPEDVPINPGQTYVFTIPEVRWKGLESMRKKMNLQSEATSNIVVRFDAISFGDRTGFIAGRSRDYRR